MADPNTPSVANVSDSETFETLGVLFGRRLRAAGLAATPERAVRFARALELAAPATRTELYWLARAVYTSQPGDIPPFDAVFAQGFHGIGGPADSRGDPGAPELAPGPTIRSRGPQSQTEGERDVPLAAASAEERLQQKSFADMDEAELAMAAQLMRALVLAPPLRRARRV